MTTHSGINQQSRKVFVLMYQVIKSENAINGNYKLKFKYVGFVRAICKIRPGYSRNASKP